MKNIAFALCSLVCIATSAHAGLPKEMDHLKNRKGTLITTYSGKVYENESNIECSITEAAYDDGTDSVMIDAGSYFPATGFLEGSKKEVKGETIVYTLNDSGKRPGGSACGDMSPLTSYKKTVTVTKNSLTIREKFTCAIFDRNDYIRTWTLK